MKRIKPLYDRIVVEKIEQKGDVQTAGGVYMPEMAREESQLGRVLAVGPGKNFDGPGATQITKPSDAPPAGFHEYHAHIHKPLQVKVGDVVAFGKFSGMEVHLDVNTTAFILREDEVLGIVEDDEEPLAEA